MRGYSIKTITVALASAAVFSACSGDHINQTKKVDAVKVGLSRPVKVVTKAIHASGQVESSQTATISTRMMGRITSIKVKPGDKVIKGQLMITLSDNDVLARKGQAIAAILEAEAALKDAQKDLERYTELYQQQSASKKELENITLRYESVKSRAEAARQMKRETEEMLAYTNITAPFNNVVTQKYAAEGSLASPGMPLLTIEQQGVFQVTTSVDESEIGRVAPGVHADVIIKSNGRVIN